MFKSGFFKANHFAPGFFYNGGIVVFVVKLSQGLRQNIGRMMR